MKREIVMVFGGAGGIGVPIVRKLADSFHVVVVDKNQEAGEKLPGRYIDFVEADVIDFEAIGRLSSAIDAQYYPVSHIVSLAGEAFLEEYDGFEGLEMNVIERSIRLNLLSHINILKHFYPLIERSGASNKSVTFISSINAMKGYGLPAYSSAKAGLYGFMHSLVDEMGAKHIRVNCISPGTVPTPKTLQEPKDFDGYKKGTALNRLTTPEEVANGVYALICLMTSVTGQNLVIDSGQTVTAKGM